MNPTRIIQTPLLSTSSAGWSEAIIPLSDDRAVLPSAACDPEIQRQSRAKIIKGMISNYRRENWWPVWR